MRSAVVEVADLRVGLVGSPIDVVSEISFTIGEGEVLGLVGESGCGKTTVGLALLGYSRRGARIEAGTVVIDGQDILALQGGDLQEFRGRIVTYIPQDPAAALNPALRIRTQLEEMLKTHLPDMGKKERDRRLAEMMREVRLPDDPGFLRRYTHQLSGGQLQRVAIAMAFACRPRVIVCDEPTTGLDVTTQTHVLETLRDLCRSHRVAVLYVSHDLAVVADLADRCAVMYAGRIVESARRKEIFFGSRHPYTRRLLRSVPEVSGRRGLVGIPGTAPAPAARPPGCFFAPRCEHAIDECRETFPPVSRIGRDHEVRCFRATELGKLPITPPPVRIGAEEEDVLAVSNLDAWYGEGEAILHGIDVAVRNRECLALVGESGSGKTTLARCIAGLHRHYSGEVRLHGALLPQGARERTANMRKEIQYIFQSPYTSLNPRRTVGQILARPLRLFSGLGHNEAIRSAGDYLERVALGAHMLSRYPDQLSGGERQRVAIARALAAKPSLIVCDEITSALDVSIQGAIVGLLEELREQMGLSLLFVTHNLALIRTIADRVAVMNEGRIIEFGEVADVFEAPRAPYTRELLANTPSLEVLAT